MKLTKKEYDIVFPIGKDLKLPPADNGVVIENTSILSNEEFIRKVSMIYYGAQDFNRKKYKGRLGPFGLYPHQQQQVLALAYSLVNGHFGGKSTEIATTFSRRGGKTEGELIVLDFLLVFAPRIFEKNTFEIVMTVNKQDQAAFFTFLHDMVKESERQGLTTVTPFGRTEKLKIKTRGRKKEIELNSGAILKVFSLGADDHTGISADWLIIAEAQGVSLKAGMDIRNNIDPMMKMVNGTKSSSGVANDHRTYFKELLENPKVYIIKRDVSRILEVLVIYVKNSDYLPYRNNLMGLKDDYDDYIEGRLGRKEKAAFETQFMLKWLKGGVDSFVSMEIIEALSLDYEYIEPEEMTGRGKVGIDLGQKSDGSWLTILEELEDGNKQVVNWMTFPRNTAMPVQANLMIDWLMPYIQTGKIDQILFDSTGGGSTFAQFFEIEYEKRVEKGECESIEISEIPFSSKSKDHMGSQMLTSFENSSIVFPKNHELYQEFYNQFENLVGGIRAGKVFFHHRNDTQKDDACDSLGLADVGFTEEYDDGHYGQLEYI